MLEERWATLSPDEYLRERAAVGEERRPASA
jgi:hypothetical protein